MSSVTQEVGANGVLIPTALLESCGLEEIRRMRVDWNGTSLVLTPAEANQADIRRAAIRYLAREVGDLTAIREPLEGADGWRVEVLIQPELVCVGELRFDRTGALDRSRSTSIPEMDAAIEAIDADHTPQ